MADTRQRRILLVEDYPSLAQMTSKMIGLMGHRALVAGSVAEAVETDVSGLDMVLCDFSLPDGDAVTLRDALRPRTSAKFVVLSAHDLDETTQHRGFDGYLAKPLDAEKLAEVIAELCP